MTLERLKSIAGQAERHLADWGLSRVSIGCETDDDDYFTLNVVDEAKSFVVTFAMVRHDGLMTINLNPRNHLVIKVDDLSDQDLSLMFAFSALSNLLSHKTGWLPLSATALILSWGYDHTENAWEVEVLAIKDVPCVDQSSDVLMSLNLVLGGKGRAALRGLLSGNGWDVTFKRLGDLNTLMRAMVMLALAFASGLNPTLKP
jgi:hypothetical protein